MSRLKIILMPAFTLILSVFASLALVAQSPPVAPPAQPAVSVYMSPLFYALVFVAFVLLVFITQLGKVLSAVAKNYNKGDNSTWDKLKSLVVLVFLSIAFSQEATAQAMPTKEIAEPNSMLNFLHHGFGNNAINALVVIILVELLVVLYLVRMIKLFMTKEREPEPMVIKQKSASVFWDRFNKSIAIESEAAVMTDHDYDGIRELDNALPPWWIYGFYFTIVWAFFYMAYYHISGGPSSDQEYRAQMEEAAVQNASFRAASKNLVDETNVVLLTEAADINGGKAIFAQFCAVCHSPEGGGLVGPNLTDKNWLHGGDIKDLFNTIKYGVQGKGMKSWQQELSPAMMAQVSSFVLSLQGTSPANPKAPEGEIWQPKNAAATGDTATVATPDTLAMPASKDGIVQ